jgi:membrane protein DedA with SNARE-associated domain
MNDLLAPLVSWVLSVIERGGYVGVASLTLLEVVFPPIPSELILPFAGFLVARGQFAFVGVVGAATLGSVIGALLLYGVGYWLGEARVRALVRDHGRWAALRESDIEHALEWFDRHGGKAVLLGRLVPALRSLISIPAGVNRMPLGWFILYTGLGSVLWNTVLVGVGWALGDQWERITPYLDVLEWAALVALAAGLVYFVWRRKNKQPEPSVGTRLERP